MPLDTMFGNTGNGSDLELEDENESSQSQSAGEQETIRRLTQVTEEQTKAKVLAELMKDPEIFAVMRARQAGRQVKVVDEISQGQQQNQQRQAENDAGAETELDEATLEYV
jgi:hypothetical protein